MLMHANELAGLCLRVFLGRGKQPRAQAIIVVVVWARLMLAHINTSCMLIRRRGCFISKMSTVFFCFFYTPPGQIYLNLCFKVLLCF